MPEPSMNEDRRLNALDRVNFMHSWSRKRSFWGHSRGKQSESVEPQGQSSSTPSESVVADVPDMS
ncbi:hypothetical protein BpHYR1_016535 [Brachionus plicatilis]|uniref:Uncharacterized protein n=1 Tax=Brachionus plicatilis TaxID=10195 RepID=A0A3M7R7Q4_BRAPC|nr:hypothetical protein BpHYR1_016535 [Brachionus plicatilis]